MSKIEDVDHSEMHFDYVFDPSAWPAEYFFQEVLGSVDYNVVYLDQERLLEAEKWVSAHDSEYGNEVRKLIDSGDLTELWIATFPLGKGQLSLDFMKVPGEEIKYILPQLASAFDLAYKRFEDLRMAEEQALEAQIEAALERIRSRSMAMRQSSELESVVSAIFNELTHLEVELARCIMWIIDEEEESIHWWLANPEAEGNSVSYEMPFNDLPNTVHHLDAWRQRREHTSYVHDGNLKVEFDDYIFSETGMAELPKAAQEAMREPDTVYLYSSIGDFGLLFAPTLEPISEEHHAILQRFGKVFQQSYTRFLDVQLAEAQAREAQIEAAMERIRSRAIAMQSSSELLEVAREMREQMELLDQKDLQACVLHLYEDNSPTFETFVAMRPPNDVGKILTFQGKFRSNSHESIVEMLSRYEAGEGEYTIELDGIQGAKWQAVLEEQAPEIFQRITEYFHGVPRSEYHEFWNFADFSGGSILSVSQSPPNDESQSLLRKAAVVFDLAYRRFLDLKEAEEATREAQIEAALERVRGQAMAMQDPEDIGETTLHLFDEIETLCDSVLRLGLGLYSDTGVFQAWLVGPGPDGGRALVRGGFRDEDLPVDAKKMITEWKKGNSYSFKETPEFLEWAMKIVFKNPDLAVIREQIRLEQYLTSYPHQTGFIYLVAEKPVTPEDPDGQIVTRFMSVFDLAYQRYNDLKQAAVDYTALLEEKSKTEQALVHLQATQRQLVEQEKLASLGALTAGIAHEIKNPLNFVNNFAEVSAELMDELADAVSKGDREEVKALLSDLKDNAGQIAKHGQRADSIVRSMMMHARGGTSEKETIDLNDFLEEYANLAWHGMRARDHGFQAEIERDLQDGVGSIQAQPQELGRVILNLLNNAFDAVKKQDDGVVIISTSAKDGNIEIRISDNGPGVPEDIREKIFEPFFTTKATGEGTGLGLSLSYDIITKGHGGTMTVGESECGGANFTISLPA